MESLDYYMYPIDYTIFLGLTEALRIRVCGWSSSDNPQVPKEKAGFPPKTYRLLFMKQESRETRECID